MITETMEIKVLYPSENHFLYNAEAKTISDKVFLGKDANADYWQEITLSEKERLEEEWEKKQKKLLELRKMYDIRNDNQTVK